MKSISLETAKEMIANGFCVVVDKKGKIVHSVNKITRDHVVSYKPVYLLENKANQKDQRKITMAIAKVLAGDLKSVPDSFEWSSVGIVA